MDFIDKNENAELIKKTNKEKADKFYNSGCYNYNNSSYDHPEYEEAINNFLKAREYYELLADDFAVECCNDYIDLCENELKAIEYYKHGIECLSCRAYTSCRQAIEDFENAQFYTKSNELYYACQDKISECQYEMSD